VAEKENKTEPEPKIITPNERKRLLIEGIKKTVLPAFISAAFALAFFLKFGEAAEVSWFSILLLVVLLSYYIQKAIYPLIGVRVKEFETKDWLYVEFLTLIYLLVIWTLLINIGTLDITASPATITSGLQRDVIATVHSNGQIIVGAMVNLSGAGVNMSAITGSDGIAHFYSVNATSGGNITLTARMIGYGGGRTNITSIE